MYSLPPSFTVDESFLSTFPQDLAAFKRLDNVVLRS